MAILELEINGERLDMYGDEKVVQSFSIINIRDITARGSEYSNEFKVPKTNRNAGIIEYAEYLNTNTQFPYLRVPCKIFLDGFFFKRGIVELSLIDSDINLRFYTGNATFYDKIKGGKLTNLRMLAQDHTWNLATVLSSRFNASGFLYPLIDYGAMPSTGSTVDVRQLLPSFFDSTLMESICTENGYTLINQITGQRLTEFNTGHVPTAKKNPSIPADVLAANLYEGLFLEDNGGNSFTLFNIFQGSSFGWTDGSNIIKAPYEIQDPSNLYGGQVGVGNYGTGIFTAAISGLYKVHCEFIYDYNWDENWTSSPPKTTSVYLSMDACVNGTAITNVFNQSYSTSVTFPTSYTFNGSVNKNVFVFLNAGDQLTLKQYAQFTTTVGSYSGAISVQMNAGFFINPNFQNYKVELQPEVQFNTSVQASYFLPEFTQAEYFKDMLIRYCLVPVVDEDNKTVTIRPFEDLQNNIANADDWTNKVDQTKDRRTTFSFNEYAQKNNIKHKEDNSISVVPTGSDYVLAVNNQNLQAEKPLYTSPFAPSESVIRLGAGLDIMQILLYDSAANSFSLDVQPRKCYVEKISQSITFTDGTSNATVSTSIPVAWFIRPDKDYNAGFGNNEINRNSTALINILQGLKIARIDIKLNILDILNLDYFKPKKVDDVFYLVSNINQFSYTDNGSTDVELIKIN